MPDIQHIEQRTFYRAQDEGRLYGRDDRKHQGGDAESLIERDLPFTKEILTREEGIERIKEIGDKAKLRLIESMAEAQDTCSSIHWTDTVSSSILHNGAVHKVREQVQTGKVQRGAFC